MKEVEGAVQALKLQLQVLEVREPNDFNSAFGAAKKGRAGAVDILNSAFLNAHRKKFVESGERSGLPVIYSNNTFVEAGGLMSFVEAGGLMSMGGALQTISGALPRMSTNPERCQAGGSSRRPAEEVRVHH